MPELFATKSLRPMLIGKSSPPFDDADSLFELKLDGERCLAWLDGSGTVLVNRRGFRLLPRLPELENINRQAGVRCILDGEIIIGIGGKEDFEPIRSRLAGQNRLRAKLLEKQHPASFVVFDILYHAGTAVTNLPLEERKHLLRKAVTDGPRMAVARTVEAQGKAFYEMVLRRGLEGVVGKKKNSLYSPGKRTTEWVKVKNLEEDDYVIGGYVPAEHVAMLLLGQYNAQGRLVYKGRATLGLRTDDFAQISRASRAETPPFAGALPKAEPAAVWLKPGLVCTVEYLRRFEGGSMRQPHYRRLRPDKAPQEAIETL